MDIGSGKDYPSCALSNFSPHRFIIDGVECFSMEGFLQSLKFKNSEIQKEVCKLVGLKAKFKGKKSKWFQNQKLYWLDKEMARDSNDYQLLLDRAYNEMYKQSDSFRRALKAAHGAVFTHSMGKNKTNETVLTTREFCRRLTELRDFGEIK